MNLLCIFIQQRVEQLKKADETALQQPKWQHNICIPGYRAIKIIQRVVTGEQLPACLFDTMYDE